MRASSARGRGVHLGLDARGSWAALYRATAVGTVVVGVLLGVIALVAGQTVVAAVFGVFAVAGLTGWLAARAKQGSPEQGSQGSGAGHE